MWRIRTLLRMVDAWMTVAASKGLLFVLLLTFSILPLSSSSLEPIEQSTGTSMSSEGSINFQTAKGFATMLSLEARKANSSSGSPERNRRTLLGDSRMALHDDLLSKGYFTSKLFIGMPPAEFALIVDTGRTITYMPCSTCTHYGHHQDAAFSPSASSTYESIPCTSPLCNAGFYGANKGNFTGLIVEEASARCDIDAYYSINANHFDVCRPVSTVCGSFLRLSDLIATVLHKAALVELVELKRSSGEQALEEAKERTRFNCISPNIREGLLEAFYGIYEKDPDKVLQAMVQMGVLVPTGDLTAVRRTAQFFLKKYADKNGLLLAIDL